MRHLRILHVINSLETGGAQRLIGDLLPSLDASTAASVSVVVFHHSNSGIESRLKEKGISVISLNTKERSLSAIAKLIPHIRKADIIHAHLFPTCYMVALANIFCHKPLIYTEHSTHNKRRDHKWLKPLEKLIYSRYNRIVCISNATAINLGKWIGKKICDNKVSIIHNGIDLSKFQRLKPSNQTSLFGRSGIPILMISRFTASKDQATVIKALSLIKNTDVFVAFAGEGETMSEMKALTNEYNLSDRVLFLGNREDIPQLIKVSYIGIQSSRWEGFGLTVVEMMAGKIPVIVSDIHGLREISADTTLTFKPGDYKTLAQLIDTLLEDPLKYEEIANRCAERALDFSITDTIAKHIELYNDLTTQISGSKRLG